MHAKILIVEDDRRLLSAIRSQLLQFGYPSIACNNVVEAMSQFTEGNMELVITDLTMPGIDGMGMLSLIRSQSDVPIIVVTGHADEYERTIKQYSKVMLIRKPFELRALAACVGIFVSPEAKVAS